MTTAAENLEEEMRDAVKEHLPAHVGEVLQARLKRLKELEELTVKQENERYVREKTVEQLRDEKFKLEAMLQSHQELDKREAAIEVRERELNIKLLQKDVDCANLVTQNALYVVERAFGNPNYQTARFKSYPHFDQYGNQVSFASETTSETTSVQETGSPRPTPSHGATE